MKKKGWLLAGLAMAMMMTACSGGTSNSAATIAPEKEEAKADPAETPEIQWPFTDKELTFYTRNSAGGSVTLAQQYLLDLVFEGTGATNLLVSDATSGGAVCVEKTYAAGGDGYTFYMSGNEMVIGDILGTFDYSVRDDFQVLGMLPSNGAPNFLSVSRTTLADVTTMEELVDYCKTHPGEVRFAYAPDTLGEVYVTLFARKFDLDVKMTISEGQDSKPNLMGSIVDVVVWNQNDTLEYMQDYITPLVALSTERSVKPELSDIPCYGDKGMEDCVVPSLMFLVCRNDIDPALAQAINTRWNQAIADAVSSSPSDKGKLLKEYMETQNQMLEIMTIKECEAVIEEEYAAIEPVLGRR